MNDATIRAMSLALDMLLSDKIEPAGKNMVQVGTVFRHPFTGSRMTLYIYQHSAGYAISVPSRYCGSVSESYIWDISDDMHMLIDPYQTYHINELPYAVVDLMVEAIRCIALSEVDERGGSASA